MGPDPQDLAQMLAVLDYDSLDALIDAVIPADIRTDRPLPLPPPLDEPAVLRALGDLADRNQARRSMIGLGYHDTVTPPVITRNVLQNPAWYTAYTPYQPEISQGRLEGLLTFQTLVADLTGLPVANASLLDEPTAAAEAMALAHRVGRGDTFAVDRDLHPQTLAVLATRAEPIGVRLVVLDLMREELPEDCFGVLAGYPSATGAVHDLTALAARIHDAGGLLTVTADPLALVLLRPPADMGADVVVGSAQRFGVPMGFGGPHAAFMAVRSGLERQLPGRMVGVSVDANGQPALRLALQTREQHIRRDRATSNICTSQVLLALVAAFYAQYHGPEGLREIAQRVHDHANTLAASLAAGGLHLRHQVLFDTVVVEHSDPGAVVSEAARRGIDLRLLDGAVGITCDERTSSQDVDDVLAAFGVPVVEAAPRLTATELRDPDILDFPEFRSYHNETAMMRYLRRLSDKDLALDRSMIPLGSCTMKLNAAVEMEALTWPQFAGLHPFAPIAYSAGTREMIADLEDWLAAATGYDRVSVQPNAGSQGEFAGLLAIRAYHRSRGDDQRTVCLVPSSAHGTNAASAVMAGLRVVVVKCTDAGDVDIEDVRAKVAEHGETIAAIMLTYPSTHGVFETGLREICELVHGAGGQVYVDGANMNALVGLVRLPDVGADVSHLNLHKTFCIPHGGGGPGVGPVAVKEHLAPFLPGHPLVAGAGPADQGPVSGAPWGSAGVLMIPWAYVRLMGGDGLTEATKTAILSANYVARRLSPHFPLLYSGEHGLVAHECLLDLREITRTTGVTVDDVAKRLIDHGFHAPTMSFPVAGTLMVEPTESEDLRELDRFCDAMIAIRGEIDEIADGRMPLADSPLRHAPHTATTIVADWDRPYSRERAVFPSGSAAKYWPPTGRIDNAYGDRNLHCTCAPVTAYS
ncbi:MAG TPA: aminomethyl-transferring glycine dehydrogenase [Candidatus Nanopelagicales bacterium]|nr:aminomethyl-transferring glycine dehydrogenase [Candidatus Nanopelagicales bacterium]